MRRRRETRPAVRRSPSWRRSPTGRLRRSVVPRSRRESRRLRSLPTGLPSNSARSRSRGAPRTGSRRRRPCGRASRRNDVRAACRAPRRLVLVGAAATAAAGGRRRAGRLRFGHLRRALPRRPCSHRPRARRQRRGDAHQDILGLADRARRHRTAPPRGRALLRGVAAERRRRARAGRDVQRGPERDALGGRLAEGLHDADRHARAGRRRSGLVGREGARRNECPATGSVSRPRSVARPAGGRGRGGSSPCPRGSAGPVPPPCRRGR